MTVLQPTDPLWTAIERLLESISIDNRSGLLSRETMALADACRVQVHVDRRRERDESLRAAALPSPDNPVRLDS